MAHRPSRSTCGTHEMLHVVLVNGAAIDASASDKLTPTSAAFNAAQSLAPSPHIPTHLPSLAIASTMSCFCSGRIRAKMCAWPSIFCSCSSCSSDQEDVSGALVSCGLDAAAPREVSALPVRSTSRARPVTASSMVLAAVEVGRVKEFAAAGGGGGLAWTIEERRCGSQSSIERCKRVSSSVSSREGFGTDVARDVLERPW